MPTAPAHDPIRDALIAYGVPTRDFFDEDDPEDPFVGPLVALPNSELVYRRPNDQELVIVLYRRLQRPAALANPFADLMAFLLLATEPRFGLRRVLTNPVPWDEDDPRSPPAERLERAYIRQFGAQWTWYQFYLFLCADAAELHQRMQRVRHKATPLPVPGKAA